MQVENFKVKMRSLILKAIGARINYELDKREGKDDRSLQEYTHYLDVFQVMCNSDDEEQAYWKRMQIKKNIDEFAGPNSTENERTIVMYEVFDLMFDEA